MMTRLPVVMARGALARAVIGTDVTLRWVTVAGGTVDPVTGGVSGGVVTNHELVVKALVHSLHAKSALKQFSEMKTGDMLVDFAPDVALDGKQGLEFVVDGRRYTQKKLPDQVSQMFDAVVAGQRLHRTVALELAT